MKQAINIIFDGPPEHNSGRFVEVETDDGYSINIGEWVQKGNCWALRINELPDDIEAEITERIRNSRIDRRSTREQLTSAKNLQVELIDIINKHIQRGLSKPDITKSIQWVADNVKCS